MTHALVVHDIRRFIVANYNNRFENFLPYFKKSVSFTPPNTEKRILNCTTIYEADAFESPGGPVQVCVPESSPQCFYVPPSELLTVRYL
jgi:hypothetical protein